MKKKKIQTCDILLRNCVLIGSLALLTTNNDLAISWRKRTFSQDPIL